MTDRIRIQRRKPHESSELVQSTLESGGQPLDAATRAALEPRFGHSFADVRVHTDARAAQSAEAVQARAYTAGSDIAFGAGQYAPGTANGDRLIAHELTHVVQQSGAAPTAQNTLTTNRPGDAYEQEADRVATQVSGPSDLAGRVTVAQTAPISIQGGWLGDAFTAIGTFFTNVSALNSVTSADPTTTTTWPQTITIEGEKVEVANEHEQQEAQRIFTDVKEKYGITISSLSGVEAIKKDYSAVPEGVRNGLQTKEWKFKELAALERALDHYGPILGKSRAFSIRAGDDQEVTSVGKVKQAIDEPTASGQLDTTTLGEYFASSKNFSMFEAGEDSTVDFPGQNAKQLEATTIHEIAHGLLKYALADYVKALDFWLDEATASGKADAEAPITDYGAKNAGEDLSEAAMFFFLEPDTLKNGRGQAQGTPGNACPKRYLFFSNLVASWGPNDAPIPTGEPETAVA